MPVTTNTRKLAALLGASGAGIGTDGTLQSAGIDTDMATQAELDAVTAASEAADNKITSNQAILAIRQAADHNDVKYNLQDRIIDNYYDASGIDTGASTNEILTAGAYSGSQVATVSTTGSPSTGIDGNYTWYKWITTGTTWTYQTNLAQDHDYLVVAGGGGGGSHASGGGAGAGGFRTAAGLAVAADTSISVIIGTGGTSNNTGTDDATSGADSTFSSIVSTGGGAGRYTNVGVNGGSGSGGANGSQGTSRAGGISSPVTSPVQGYAGGTSAASQTYSSAGGGGAGAVGTANVGKAGGSGGIGEDEVMGMNAADSYSFLTAVSAGEVVSGARYFAGGGGAGTGWSDGTIGSGGHGGGGDGAKYITGTSPAGLANTGGGGGGASGQIGVGSGTGGDGGTGIVIIRRLTGIYGNLTLQSTDTEAETQPTKADMVMLVEDAGSGVGAVQTHIKGWISRDSGTTFTQGTLVDEGDWGTDKRILAFHDLDISGQPADQTMCYKITTHSASAVYDTKIHATSIGWK